MIRSLRFFLLVFVLAGASALHGQTRLVISQLYGGGGNTGAQYTNDFIELYNPTATAISLNGLSLQYASAASASWNSVALPNASVAAGHYFLIQAAAGTTVTNVPLAPAADFVVPATGSSGNPLNLSATAGKVVIANGTTPLTVACPITSQYVDLIGYGVTTCFEGTGPAPAPSNTTADVRANLTVDLVNNATDYTTAAPVPHNSGNAVTPPTVTTVPIHTIQGVKSTSGSTVSSYAGQQVTTTGVVTAVTSTGFFLQARDVDADANPLTPEGIDVFTGSKPTVAVGNYLQVSGTVQTYPAVTASHTPATELTSPTITVLAAVATLPAPITITSAMLTPSGGLYQLTPYEGMRVTLGSITTSSGTGGSITAANEPAEIATSNGYFYGVITGTPRPFREPGIDIRDPAVPGLPVGVAHFDDNPERILIDSTLGGGTSIELSTGAILPNVTGVLDFTFSSDAFYDPSRLILDPGYDRTQVVPGITVQPAGPVAANEFTVASFNIERFFNPAQATPDDLYYVPAGVTGYNGTSSSGTVSNGQTYISEAVDVTAAAYATRLNKLSLAIRNVLNLPDVVTLEEVENQNVANDIAAKVNADAGVTGLYTAYSTDDSTYFSQDGTGISVGFLVKNTVDRLGFSQFGANETFVPSSSTNPTTLNDRPWLVLNAGIKRGAGIKDYPVTVIVNHMKALTGQNSTTSTSTRQKKELQAEDIARYIQTLQAQGQHVISGGDFNAFEFSDGYNDTLGTYTNVNVLPATQVVQPGVAGLVSPPLTDLALTLPAAQRWSYQEDGSAQILDHMVVTADLIATGVRFAYLHLDADFPLTAYNDPTTAARVSDHDAALGYFILPSPVLSGTLTPATGSFGSGTIGTSSTGQVFTFSNTGEAPVIISSVNAGGDYTVSTTCATVPINGTCTANVVFTPTAAGTRSATLTVATNVPGATFTAALSGTGVSPALPTFSSAALTFVGTVLNTASTTQSITVANTGPTPVAVASIAATGDFTQTNSCGASIAANSTCTITITFKPTAAGTRTGTLSFTSTGLAATTLTASLTGTGLMPDFSLLTSAGNSTITLPGVSAGSSATTTLNLTAINTFAAAVTFTCTYAGTPPAGVACNVPAAVTPSGTAALPETVTFTTVSRVLGSGFVLTGRSTTTATGLILAFAGLPLLFAYRARKLGRTARLGHRFLLLLLTLVVTSLAASGCAGGPGVNPGGTPAGSYTYTVTAASGTLTHSDTITVVVQ